jgi:hypothetical protein
MALSRQFADGSTLFERLRTGEHVKTDAGLVRPDGHLAQSSA